MRLGLVTNGIDFENLSYANYTTNLTSRLQRLDSTLDLCSVHCRRMEHSLYRELPEVLRPRRAFSPLRPPWAWDLPGNRLSSVPVDLLHDLTSTAGMVWKAPYRKVLTIHDTASTLFPKLCPRGRLVWRIFGKALVRRVDRIIAISESTRRDVIRLFRANPAKVKVIHLAAGSQFSPAAPAAVAEFRRRLQLPDRFFLYLGVLQPRKNLPTLLRAFALARGRGLAHQLVIAGPKGWDYEPIYALGQELGLTGLVRFTGPLAAEDVPLAYGAAEAFVFPSVYEGFGFPPLEAMCCGTPVICSNASSLPEVVGDAGLMAAPEDVEGFAHHLLTLAGDSGLRERMRMAGFQQARKFSWEKCAAQTLEVYRDVMAGTEPGKRVI